MVQIGEKGSNLLIKAMKQEKMYLKINGGR
jgi:hypothetical protein